MDPGIRLVAEEEGTGRRAERGDSVVFDCALTLNRGDVVSRRGRQETRLGSRELIAGIEKALEGMSKGGYRKVRISPHLAYGDQGVPDRVPPNAVLICKTRLESVTASGPESH